MTQATSHEARSTRRVVFWQSTVTSHQSETLKELDKRLGFEVVAYEVYAEDAHRVAQGWTRPSIAFEVAPLLGPSFWLSAILLLIRERRSTHFLWGPFSSKRMIYLTALSSLLGLRHFMVSEPYSPSGLGYFSSRSRAGDAIKSWLRPLMYQVYGALLCRRTSGVFAISDLAVSQFRQMGIPAEKVFPFGYFVRCEERKEPNPQPTEADESHALRCVFVGSLIPRKGVDLLPRAARYVFDRGVPILIDVYGPGIPGDKLLWDDRVRFLGPIPFGNASEVIRNYDVLLVPSRHDGWAVVVNEGIQGETPIVCSSAVGAKALVVDLGCGWVFQSGDADDLGRILHGLALDPGQLVRAASNARRNGHRIHPRVAADMLGLVIDGNHGSSVAAPWNSVGQHG